MIKYRAVVNGNITKENVVKETKNFICLEADKEWFTGGIRKESRESDGHKYFDNFVDAKEWAIKKLNERVETLRNQVAKAELCKIKAEEMSESNCGSYYGK